MLKGEKIMEKERYVFSPSKTVQDEGERITERFCPYVSY
jgi:hypothetical protein